MQELKKLSNLYFSLPLAKYTRFIIDDIDYQSKIIGILGQRGVGKTTLLRHIAEKIDYTIEKKLYISADNVTRKLSDIAIEFSAYGGKLLLIDEIHKAPNFSQELKTIYDFVDIKVIFSGSSALEIEHSKVDLSRRVLFYNLPSLSLREFIGIKYHINFPAYSLNEILEHHEEITQTIGKQITPLEVFDKYKEFGAYPFFTEGELGYNLRLNEISNIILDSELAIIYNVDSDKIYMIRKLLQLLCQSVPIELNINNLSRNTGISRNTLYSYLYYLQKSNLIQIIGGNFKNKKLLNKPDKIYLDNINLYNIFCDQKNNGSLRECFFVSQLKNKHQLKYSNIGDFIIDDKLIVEIGGKNKSFEQIKNTTNSFLAIDNITTGFNNRIPLWLFGFLY